jgi:hypothetical protein
MKRLQTLALLLSFCSFGAFALNEDVVAWEQIYRKADSDEQRLSVMLKIMQYKDRDFTPLLAESLDRLMTRRIEEGTQKDRMAKNALARLIVQELGNLNSGDSAESVYNLYVEVKEPVLKGEAAVALGKMRAVRYAERLALDLSSLNLRPDPVSPRDQEILALALVQALDAMRSPIGYEPVFLAARAWYSSSSRVKETAQSALVTMVDDPTDSVMKIMVSNPSTEIKNAALAAALASKSPLERKASIASQALKTGIEKVGNDPTSKAAISRLRVAAMNGLTATRDKSPENVPLLVSVIGMDAKNDATLEETLKAYVALGVNGSDAAVEFLSKKLGEYDDRERSKANTVRDKSLIRQIVASMALTKNPKVKGALLQSLNVDYDANIRNALKDALNTIG